MYTFAVVDEDKLPQGILFMIFQTTRYWARLTDPRRENLPKPKGQQETILALVIRLNDAHLGTAEHLHVAKCQLPRAGFTPTTQE
jgi:hypothetical protein